MRCSGDARQRAYDDSAHSCKLGGSLDTLSASRGSPESVCNLAKPRLGARNSSHFSLRRYPILGEFMGYVAGGDVVNAAPPVFCAYMGVLAALATTEAGAQVRLPFAQFVDISPLLPPAGLLDDQLVDGKIQVGMSIDDNWCQP